MPCPDQLDPGFGIGPPHRNAICFAKSYFGIGPDGLGIYRTGTGFLIDNGNVRRHVLTAAHNVFHHDVRREAVWISLWFGRNGATALATRDATGWSFPQAFEDAHVAPGDCDYALLRICLLYTSDAADDLLCVDLGGRRLIKKKKTPYNIQHALDLITGSP
mgnify:CR=1 FL=1